MLPKEYFDDPLTEGVAFGAFEHVLDNRFTLLSTTSSVTRVVAQLLLTTMLTTATHSVTTLLA